MWHALLYNVTEKELQVQYYSDDAVRSFIDTMPILQVQDMNKTTFISSVSAKVDSLNLADTKRDNFVTNVSQYIGKVIV